MRVYNTDQEELRKEQDAPIKAKVEGGAFVETASRAVASKTVIISPRCAGDGFLPLPRDFTR